MMLIALIGKAMYYSRSPSKYCKTSVGNERTVMYCWTQILPIIENWSPALLKCIFFEIEIINQIGIFLMSLSYIILTTLEDPRCLVKWTLVISPELDWGKIVKILIEFENLGFPSWTVKCWQTQNQTKKIRSWRLICMGSWHYILMTWSISLTCCTCIFCVVWSINIVYTKS